MNGLGRRQRRMIENMAHFGAGHWPWQWKMRNDDVTVLESLHRRGLVTSTGRFASLTNEGEKLAATLNAPVRSG